MNPEDLHKLYSDAVSLLKQLISISSFSKEEDKTADVIFHFLKQHGANPNRIKNNVWSQNVHFDLNKPTILLNSHHDTVKPNKGYTNEPFTPLEKDGKLFGLGSNDAGGSLVALAVTFLYYFERKDLKYNILFAASAEEEISGENGMEDLLNHLPDIDCAIVGEPTGMHLAIAEKGILVLDCTALGKAGHAARNEGENAIYKAIKDIEWLQNFSFEKTSSLLGPIKTTVTSIETENKAHNVVPAECKFIVDVRVNELYILEDVYKTISENISSEIKARSFRIKPTFILPEHPLVKSGVSLGRKTYGSPTTSDKALMSFPALKIGPGDSARSHTADEFIFLDEIKEGINLYIQLLNKLL